MKSIRRPIVHCDSQFNETISHGSLTLYVDTSYRREHHIRQWGKMVSDFRDLKEGEKIYFHYLSLDREPELPPDKWLMNYEMIYCVIRDSQIEMCNNYLFVEMIDEVNKPSIIIQETKKSTSKGIVRHSNHSQLNDGDTVLFNDVCAFVNEIEGKEYYVMENSDVVKVI